MVVLLKVAHRLFHRRPGIAEESEILSLGQNEVAVNHEHELRVQILPPVRVLPGKLIYVEEWILFRHAQIMGNRSLSLANA